MITVTAFIAGLCCGALLYGTYRDKKEFTESKRSFAKGKYLGYLMGRNDAFYRDDRLAEVKADAERYGE